MSTAESPVQAEAEAEHARAGLVNTLSQLRENLKPANVVDEVMSSAKINASAITDQIVETAKRNPMPALLIGAGLAMILGFGSRSSFRTSRVAARTRVPGGPADVSGRAAGRAVDAFNTATGHAGDLLDTANGRLTVALSRGADRVSSAYSNAKRSSSMSVSRQSVASSLNALIEQQPLVLAAVGVAIGAAIGAALPQTETENSLMGDTSGSVRAAAQDMVEGQIAQAKNAAQHAVEDIRQTAASHGVNADNLQGLVQDVGDKAKGAAFEASGLRQS